MLAIQVIVLAAIAALSDAAPAPATVQVRHVLHEKRTAQASDWVKGARIEADAVLPMRIGLAQTNLDRGEELLREISDPSSPKYGKHWSADDVHNMFAPAPHAVAAVKEWLTSSGIDASRIIHYDNKGWLAFDATTAEAEALLRTEFHEHEHTKSPKVRVGSDQYHLPEHLAPHIDYITPGIKLTPVVKRTVQTKRSTGFKKTMVNRIASGSPPTDGFPWDFKPAAAKKLPADLQGCSRNMTPACIKAMYHIPDATKATPGNSLGLYEQGDYFAKSDLDLFYADYAPHIPQGTYPVPALIDGANFSVPADSPLNTGESDIDIDMAFALIYPQTVTLYQVDDQIYEPEEVATTNLFNTFLDALDGSYCNYRAYGETGDDPSIDPIYPNPRPGGYKGTRQCGVFKPTKVISASYGQAEADLPINYSKRQCNEFMKLGLQGHSILTASGDYGVASFPAEGVNGCLGPEGKIFNPQYPGNCPYITSVGGSMLHADQTVENAESVMQVNLGGSAVNFSSSGGFSNYYAQPWYQKLAVAEYFAIGRPQYPHYSEFQVDLNKTKGLYNRIGRGYPDVSANGAYFRAYTAGIDEHWFGASLSSPLFASVLTLINEERFAMHKGPVGFVNPILYAFPWVLNDITNGTNLGCGSEGFQAVRGWDPVTGLGTPNFPKMKKLFLALP